MINKYVLAIGSFVFITIVTMFVVALFYNSVELDGPSASASGFVINDGDFNILSSSPTNFELQSYNKTWLDFDGTNDYTLIDSNVITSVTFWYKNRTHDWIFVANVSGVEYINGLSGNPHQYPIYYNGSSYFLGKEDASTYFNGSIDDFRIYDLELNYQDINLIYSEGRY